MQLEKKTIYLHVIIKNMVTSITGKIIEVMLPRTGTSKSGNEWVSQDFVIEEENGDKLVFNVFGQNKLDEYGLKVGTTAAVTVKVDSRKWNDKYFTQATCISCILFLICSLTNKQIQPFKMFS